MEKIKYILLLFIILLINSSCTSTNPSLEINYAPTWLEKEYESELYSYYIVEGQGYSINAATYQAINNFYNSLSDNLYIEDKQNFIDSLNDTFQYLPLKMKISKRYVKKNIDDIYQVSFLIISDKKIIEEQTEKKINFDENINKKLSDYEKNSNELYRNNKDIDSINKLVEAYIYAKENNFNNKAETFLNSIISRIMSLDIRIYYSNSKNNLLIKMYRDESFFDPLIINGRIIASYNNLDVNYENYLVEDTIYPMKDGSFNFIIDDKKINDNGLIIFKIDLNNQIKLLRKKGYIEAANLIGNTIKEKVYQYELIPEFFNKKIIIKIVENDLKQQPLENVSLDFFKEQINNLGSSLIVNQEISLSELDSIDEDGDYFFLFRAEVVEEDNKDKPFVFSHGSLEVYDLNDFSLLFDSSLLDSVEFDDSLDEARNKSILEVAKKTFYSLIR